jgi:hypothetical protein
VLGFPIRTSADQGLVDGSPQLFAVTHVLHRFLAPRHPPLALISLERTSYLFEISLKMLVLALQFSRSHRTAERCTPNGAHSSTLWHEEETPSKRKRRRWPTTRRTKRGTESLRPLVVVATAHQCTNRCVSYRMEHVSIFGREALLRKEVIQPHLPVRLPCYDFTPITDPTFDGSFPYGLGHRLRVLPTFVV